MQSLKASFPLARGLERCLFLVGYCWFVKIISANTVTVACCGILPIVLNWDNCSYFSVLHCVIALLFLRFYLYSLNSDKLQHSVLVCHSVSRSSTHIDYFIKLRLKMKFAYNTKANFGSITAKPQTFYQAIKLALVYKLATGTHQFVNKFGNAFKETLSVLEPIYAFKFN